MAKSVRKIRIPPRISIPSAITAISRSISRSISITLSIPLSIPLSIITLSLTAPPASAQVKSSTSISGNFESSLSANAGAGDAKTLSYGVEEYANIRTQTKIGDAGVFFGAVNFIAAAGDYALKAKALGVDITVGENYAAMIELERLYLRLKSETLTLDGGLMRLPFGYDKVWGPSDFLNPKNPLKPDARPRAVLGSGLSWYPVDDFKILGFAATGRDPLESTSGIAGIMADRHFDAASVQLLYSLERGDQLIATSQNPWTHRAGMSVKADIEVGLVMDMLYVYNEEIDDKIDGLSFSAGFDYSLFGANLIILAQYLYSGASSSTSIKGGGSFANENYLYTGLTWRFSDFTNAGIALVSGIDTQSSIQLITFSHEIFQGATLSLMAQIPIDNDMLFGDGNRGEFGPIPMGMNAGSHLLFEGKLKFRF